MSSSTPAARHRIEPDPLEREFAAAQTRARLFGEEHEMRVAGYPLLRRVGSGAAAIVFESRAPGPRPIALKVLRDNAGAATRKRLLREARACSRLQHPNIIEVLDVLEDRERVVLVMELAATSVRARLADPSSPPPLEDRMAWLLGALRGLAVAHRSGYVHRDFKPDNLLLRFDQSIAVADFGLALDVDESSPGGSLTHPGSVLGTAAYMPPEQRRGERVDPRADVYAWAMTAHEVLTGEAPTLSPRDTTQGLPADLPKAWAAAIAAARAASAKDRPRDADALLTALGVDG